MVPAVDEPPVFGGSSDGDSSSDGSELSGGDIDEEEGSMIVTPTATKLVKGKAKARKLSPGPQKKRCREEVSLNVRTKMK